MVTNRRRSDDYDDSNHWRFHGGMSMGSYTEDTSEELCSEVELEQGSDYSDDESSVHDEKVQVSAQQERVKRKYAVTIRPSNKLESSESPSTSQTPSICGYSTTYKDQHPMRTNLELKTRTRQAPYRRTSKRLNPTPSSSPTKASSTYMAKYWTTCHCECKECRREKAENMPPMSPRMVPFPKVMLTVVVLSMASCAALFRLCLL